MSIVYKTIPQDDQTVTPFKVYKSWEYTGTSSTRFKDLYSASIFLGTAIKPDPNNYTGGALMSLDFDRESDTNDASRLLNTHLQNTPAGMLWYALRHKYFNDYNDFISFAGNAEPLNLNTNSTEWDGYTFTATSASLNKSYNFIEDKTNPSSSYKLPSIMSVISIPQLKFGEEIKPGSFELICSSSIGRTSGNSYKIIDDSKGNLIALRYPENGFLLNYLGSNLLNNRILQLQFNECEYEKNILNSSQLNTRYPVSIDYFNTSIVTGSLGWSTFQLKDSSPTSTIYNVSSQLAIRLSGSYIRIDGTPSYFNPKIEDDYAISFWITVKSAPPLGKKQYIVSKRGLSRDYGLIARDGRRSSGNVWNLNENIFPYNIYIENVGTFGSVNIVAEISDGTQLIRLTGATAVNQAFPSHVVLTKTANKYELWVDGGDTYDFNDWTELSNITNKSDIFIGSFATEANDLNKPNSSFDGIIDSFLIFNTGLSVTDVLYLYADPNFEPSVGKIFYKEGIAVINSNNFRLAAKYGFAESGYLTMLPFSSTLYNNSPNTINHNGIRPTISTPPFSNLRATGSLNTLTVKWNSTVTIYENEILCRIREDEFNVTLNPTILKKQENSYIPQDFVYDDEFTPYITTIGLYNENAELLAVGKLANPIKKRPDVDLNIVIRFDQ